VFKPREDAPKSLEPAEQPFDLIASFIHGSVIFPWRESILLGRHHRHIAYLQGQLPRRIAFIRPIHHQGDRAWHSPDALQQLSSLRCIVGLARGQGAGVISSWRLELPSTFRTFDYTTISDVILHVRSTARAVHSRIGLSRPCFPCSFCEPKVESFSSTVRISTHRNSNAYISSVGQRSLNRNSSDTPPSRGPRSVLPRDAGVPGQRSFPMFAPLPFQYGEKIWTLS
jgi:hypothetical protein